MNTILYKGGFGRAVAQRLELRHITARSESLSENAHAVDQVDTTQPIAVVLSSPDLSSLQEIGDRLGGARWIAAFPIGCSVMITSVFEPGRPCVHCFSKRWLSLPPSGLTPETAAALCFHASVDTSFEFRAYHPMGVSAVANLLDLQLVRRAKKSVVIDTSSMVVQSGGFLSVHGCGCGQHRHVAANGGERFVSFKTEISQWLT